MKKERDFDVDIIRTIAIFFVVIIHCTANAYVDSYGTKAFYLFFILSTITSIAVPTFYMSSGMYLINIKKDVDYYIKKALIILMQTIIWTLLYYLVFKYILDWDVNIIKSVVKSIFSAQVDHLWYIYPLVGLYFLCPLISILYYKSNDNIKKYMLLLISIVPVILSTIQIKYSFVNIPLFAIGFPELGLFIIGKNIYENKNKLQKKEVTIVSLLLFSISIISCYLLFVYYKDNTLINNIKPYFDYNKIPIFVLTISFTCLVFSIKNVFINISPIIKRIVVWISNNTKGIFFIHMMFLYIFPKIKIIKIYATSNSGNILNMLLGAIIYFIFSCISIFIISKIPYMNKIIK